MEAFITGRSVISSSGAFAPPTSADARHHEHKFDSWNRRYDQQPSGSSEEGEKNDIALAERTSQLMSSYRNYITGTGDEEMPTSGASREGGRNHTARSRSSAGFGNNHNPLLREWNSSPSGQGELEMEEDYDPDGFQEDGVRGKKYRHAHRIYRSKKFKRVLIAVVVVSAIVTTIMTVSKSSGKRHLPDLDQELNVESLSNIDTALTSPVRGDQPGGSDMSVEEESNERTERTEKEEGGEPQKNGIGLPSPIQGDQPEGLDIIVEDVSVVEEEPDERTESIEEEEEVEPHHIGIDFPSPVQGDQRGNPDAAVEDVPVVEEELKEGIESTEKEVVAEPHQNIGIDLPSRVHKDKPGNPDMAVEDASEASTVEEKPNEEAISTEEEGKKDEEEEVIEAEPQRNISNDLASPVQEDTLGGSDATVEDVPVVGEKSDEGTESTEEEQLAVVAAEPEQNTSINLSSPSQEDKLGDSNMATEDVPVVKEGQDEGTESTVEEEVVAEPMMEEDVREEGTAVLTGAGLEAITRHILCCSSTPSSSSIALDAKNKAPANPANNPVADGYARAGAHHPRWYDRSHGWRGRSYQDALTFCTAQQGPGADDGVRQQLCPYEAYCPTGPQHAPLGGLRTEENEEGGTTTAYSSRAPVSDRPNGWVHVGSLNVCVQYQILEADDGSQVMKEVNDS